MCVCVCVCVSVRGRCTTKRVCERASEREREGKEFANKMISPIHGYWMLSLVVGFAGRCLFSRVCFVLFFLSVFFSFLFFGVNLFKMLPSLQRFEVFCVTASNRTLNGYDDLDLAMTLFEEKNRNKNKKNE